MPEPSLPLGHNRSRRGGCTLRVSRRGLTLSALFLIAIFQSASAGPFKIFVTGDGRADYPDPTDPAHLSPRLEDQKGINQCTIKDIADEIVKVHPDIVL